MDQKKILSNHRKKLEMSSRKTRRSEDLRRSLGRRSVGDLSPGTLAALEQRPSTSDESCHLNPDSAVLDPSILENPEWFKHLGPQDILVSQDSFNAAFQKEAASKVMRVSNVSELDMSSFNPRDIPNILGCSVVVDKQTIQQYANRQTLKNDLSASESPTFDLSEDISKPTTRRLKRGHRNTARKSIGPSVFAKVLAEVSELEEDTDIHKKLQRKVQKSASSESERNVARDDPDDQNEDISVELTPRKRTTLRRGPKNNHKNNPTSENVFKNLLEDSADPEEMASVSSNLTDKARKRSVQSRESIVSNDVSLEVPRGERKLLRGKAKSTQSTPSGNVFAHILNETYASADSSEGTLQAEQEAGGNQTAAMVLEVVSGEPIVSDDVSLEVPEKKRIHLRGGPKTRSPAVNLFTQVLNETGGSTDHSEAVLQVEGEAIATDKKTASLAESIPKEPIVTDNVSLEVPRKGQRGLKSKPKTSQSSSSAVNVFAQLLEESAVSSDKSQITPKKIPVELVAGHESSKKNKSSQRKSLDEFNQTLAPERKTNADVVTPMSKISKENVHPVSMNEGHERKGLGSSDENEVNKSSDTLPLGAEAADYSAMAHQAPLDVSTSKDPEDNFRDNRRFSGSRLNPQDRGNSSEASSQAFMADKVRDTRVRYSAMSSQDLPSIRGSPHVLDQDKSSVMNVSTISSATRLAILNECQLNDQNQISAYSISAQSEPGVVLLESSIGEAQPIKTSKNLDKSTLFTIKEMNSRSLNADSDDAPSNVSSASTELIPSESLETFPSSLNLHSSNSFGDALPPSNVPEVNHSLNNSWTENPFADASMLISSKKLAQVEGSENEESSGDSEEALENEDSSGYSEENEGLEYENSDDSEEMPIEKIVDSSKKQSGTNFNSEIQNVEGKDTSPALSQIPTPTFSSNISISTVRTQPLATEAHTSKSTVSNKETGYVSVSPAPVHLVINNKSQKVSNGLSKKKAFGKPSGEELEKMRAGMKKWIEDIRNNLHVCKEVRTDPPAPKSVKKPVGVTSKAPKKKGPCPYFGDYKPPKRVKPRPYVTPKMYKQLESNLKPKFGLEARIKAEEFVYYMCNLVESTIKKKSKYHPLVFKLRNEMVKLGLIKTQFEFHLFIEDYLPDAFRVKAIPSVGNPKGPVLDVEDIHEDLSRKYC